MDYIQLLEIECPFCSETQPSESAQWDESDAGYTAICRNCGKVFSGLVLMTALIDDRPRTRSTSA